MISEIYFVCKNIRKKNNKALQKELNRCKIGVKKIKKLHVYIVIQKKCLPLQAFWHNEIEIWGVKPP